MKYTTLAEGVTYSNSPDDGYATITGGQISSVGTFTLMITDLDRTEKLISGEFTFEGKGDVIKFLGTRNCTKQKICCCKNRPTKLLV